MDLHQRIKHHFNESIQIKIDAADTLTDDIALAGESIVNCLLSNHKVITCGNGTSATIAQLFASLMLHRFETERPSLPALALNTNNATLSAIANDGNYRLVFAKQIKALGVAGDTLLIINTSGLSPNIIAAIDAAHQRNVPIIMLSGNDGGEAATLLTDTDIEVRVPSDSSARIHEAHMLIIHCLCDIIDRQLFITEDT